MRKFLILLLCFTVCLPAAFGASAAKPALPDNIYFRAMRDEMDRTLKKLRSKNAPAPYYVAYKLSRQFEFSMDASLGELFSEKTEPGERLSAAVILGVGSDKNDQLGFDNNRFYYMPSSRAFVGDSYDAIRHALWHLTDAEYIISLDSYVKKQAYKRKKQLPADLPDVTPAPQAAVFEDKGTFAVPDAAKWGKILKRLSAQGKTVSQLEDFGVFFQVDAREDYYLNSLGGAYQIPFTRAKLTLYAQLRNKDGYEQSFNETVSIPDYLNPDEKELTEKTDAFLTEMAERYNAYKAETYLGPVLFRPRAAAAFIMDNFVLAVENVKPLLSDEYEQDETAGWFREKKGMRVLSNVLDISDKPLLREYKGLPLVYMPVDDEGVPSQDLQLTSLGRLRVFPLSRRPLGEDHHSNGHARLSGHSYPRERLTNVFVQAKAPLTEEALNGEFLEMCRDWEQEYCYEVESFGSSNKTNRAWRVYTEDGRRVPAYGLDFSNLLSRSLRDIAAVGGEEQVFYGAGDGNTVITPSLLLEEAEILPADAKPDQARFVPKP